MKVPQCMLTSANIKPRYMQWEGIGAWQFSQFSLEKLLNLKHADKAEVLITTTRTKTSTGCSLVAMGNSESWAAHSHRRPSRARIFPCCIRRRSTLCTLDMTVRHCGMYLESSAFMSPWTNLAVRTYRHQPKVSCDRGHGPHAPKCLPRLCNASSTRPPDWHRLPWHPRTWNLLPSEWTNNTGSLHRNEPIAARSTCRVWNPWY